MSYETTEFSVRILLRDARVKVWAEPEGAEHKRERDGRNGDGGGDG